MSYRSVFIGSLALVLAAGSVSAASAQEHRRHVAHRRAVVAAAGAEGDRPLTIGGRRGHGIYRVGNDIIAPGGFSAHGYGYPPATANDRREAYNARLRAASSGPYGYGVDGLGGLGFEDDRETGYNNPYWGNAFNTYVGYNGVPTDLAFGPGFANRHLADHDPFDDDDQPGPSPEDLGYSPAQ